VRRGNIADVTPAAPRPRAERRRDTEHRLQHDVDVWVASASAAGSPHLVPLSFDWDGTALILATARDSPTGLNLAATRTARIALGGTRDVTMIEGDVEVLDMTALPPEQGDRFAVQLQQSNVPLGRSGRLRGCRADRAETQARDYCSQTGPGVNQAPDGASLQFQHGPTMRHPCGA